MITPWLAPGGATPHSRIVALGSAWLAELEMAVIRGEVQISSWGGHSEGGPARSWPSRVTALVLGVLARSHLEAHLPWTYLVMPVGGHDD